MHIDARELSSPLKFCLIIEYPPYFIEFYLHQWNTKYSILRIYRRQNWIQNHFDYRQFTTRQFQIQFKKNIVPGWIPEFLGSLGTVRLRKLKSQ